MLRIGASQDVILQNLHMAFMRDLRDAYEASLSLWREIDELDGRMAWKTVKGRDYLYHLHGHSGQGRSLGCTAMAPAIWIWRRRSSSKGHAGLSTVALDNA